MASGSIALICNRRTSETSWILKLQCKFPTGNSFEEEITFVRMNPKEYLCFPFRCECCCYVNTAWCSSCPSETWRTEPNGQSVSLNFNKCLKTSRILHQQHRFQSPQTKLLSKVKQLCSKKASWKLIYIAYQLCTKWSSWWTLPVVAQHHAKR